MKNPSQPTKTIDPVRNPFNRSPWWRAILVLALNFAVACFALSPGPNAFGVEPPPDGGYPGENTAEGEDALFSLVPGGAENVALGYHALHDTTTGINNTATGNDALTANTTGNANTANGWHSLEVNRTGLHNTGVGCDSLFNNTIGSDNIGLGFRGGANLTTGSNNIDIGNAGVAGESNTIRIGTSGNHIATYVAGVRGIAITGAQAVGVNANGQLGVRASSARFKEAISSMDKESEAILALRPVSFRYQKRLDPKGVPQFGLVAEEVAKVNPDLVVPDEEGKPSSVRYEEVNAMLLNEFLKEHRKVEDQNRKIQEQEATIRQLEKGMKTVIARLEEQASQLQKVSGELAAASLSHGGLEMSKPGSQMAATNP